RGGHSGTTLDVEPRPVGQFDVIGRRIGGLLEVATRAREISQVDLRTARPVRRLRSNTAQRVIRQSPIGGMERGVCVPRSERKLSDAEQGAVGPRRLRILYAGAAKIAERGVGVGRNH